MQFIEFPLIDVKIEGMDAVRIPRMIKVKQRYDDSAIDNIPVHTRTQMIKKLSSPDQYRDKRICITAGSRGIPDIDIIIKAVADVLKEWGAKPFVVPAMGSHGGATAEGQLELLASYNVTEEFLGVPILSSMEVTRIGELPDGTDVYCDKNAAESDGIVILNKVKPHTDFRAKHESGLAKMMSIGLGKHVGASQFHLKGFHTFAERIPQVCGVFLEKLPIAFGVGIVQNAYDEISYVEVCEGQDLLKLDAELQVIAKNSIPRFKFTDIDVLIIDEIGKNISGNGADPNVTGRGNSPGFDDILNVKKLFIRGLTEESNHNGCGINLADMTTRRCLNDIDFESTWINVITSTMLSGGKIPMYQETDYDALRVCIRTCNNIDYANPRIIRVRDTLSLEYIEVSENYYDECLKNPEVEILSEPHEMQFDADGFII